MSEPSILLCPGQGAQAIGMGQAWYETSSAAKAIFDQANDLLDFDLKARCFEGPEDQINRTDIAQAALYVASVASYHGLIEAGKLNEADVIATAGLSLGEFTALHLAGAIDFASGLKLVRLRGQAMQAAAEASDSSMVALIKADEQTAEKLCAEVLAESPDSVLVPANFNAPGQIVISGSKAACEIAVTKGKSFKVIAKEIAVAGAFHSPLMAPAAEKLSAALKETEFQAPRVPVLSNVTAEVHVDDVDTIRQRLIEQLTSPVRWAQSMSWATENLSGRFIELAPGNVLAGLMKRINKETKVLSMDKPELAEAL